MWFFLVCLHEPNPELVKEILEAFSKYIVYTSCGHRIIFSRILLGKVTCTRVESDNHHGEFSFFKFNHTIFLFYKLVCIHAKEIAFSTKVRSWYQMPHFLYGTGFYLDHTFPFSFKLEFMGGKDRLCLGFHWGRKISVEVSWT